VFEEAARLLREAVDLSVATGNLWTLSGVLSMLARIAVRLDVLDLGARLFGASASYVGELATSENAQLAPLVRHALEQVQRSLEPRMFEEEWRHGREAGLADIGEMGRAVESRSFR
jgi:hypothetical protein